MATSPLPFLGLPLMNSTPGSDHHGNHKEVESRWVSPKAVSACTVGDTGV